MIQVSSLIRMIGRALYVLSVFLILFFLFSSRRVLSGTFFARIFLMSFILAGAGAFSMLISEKM
jgi:hypothetical protein